MEIIDIKDKDGNNKKAEVVLRFKDQENNIYYMIYKCNDEYFAAKYDDVIGTSKLDTNLNDKELKMLESLLNKLPEV